MTAAAITEAQWQQQVTDLAELLGWSWVHFRAARTVQGWRTPVSGPLGAGWPDLVLTRARDQRLIFAELKRHRGHVSGEQVHVLDQLMRIADGHRVQVYVWRPPDLPTVREILR